MRIRILVCVAVVLLAEPAVFAQFGKLRDTIGKVDRVVDKFKDIEISDEEEIKLGEDISGRIRSHYGVVQDPAIHKYVTLIGTVIAKKSSRSGLPYHFIVLDTDGVNAFAAPGGFIHITRGALSLMKTEAQLGGVLAHEIAHVTEKHTIKAIRNGKIVQMGANERSVSANPALFKKLADECYKIVFAGFGRGDELDSDEHGILFSSATGYEPAGLGQFLTALRDRNASSDARQGLFASHPEMNERLEKLDALIKASNLAGGVDGQDRLAKNVTYKPVDQAQIVVAGEGAAGLAGGGKSDDSEKKEGQDDGSKKSRFSLSKLKTTTGTGEQTKQSASVTGSGGSRGVDKERAAKGGSNASVVAASITPQELEDFKKEGKLKA